MLLKSFLPKNSSLRFRININKKSLNLKKFKNLFILKKKNSNKNNSGRNNLGKITVRHKGAGLFNFRRNVDIYRNYDNINNTFIGYDIDKRYSCFLGLVKYDNGCINYIFAPHNLLKNQVINYTLNFKESRVGSTMLLG
jgi:large subunit ribosomal protein L2